MKFMDATQCGSGWARVWRTACVIAMLASLLISPLMASAQTLRGNEYTTTTGDRTVTWSDDWTASVEGDDDFSTMVMVEGQIMIYAVMFVHDSSVALNPRVVYSTLSSVLISSFETEPYSSQDWAGDDGAYHGLHIMNLSGIDFVVYMRVDPAVGSGGPTMQLAAAPLSAFPSSLETMQQQLTVDGRPVFENEDPEEIRELIAAATSDAAPADDAVAAEDATESSSSRRSSSLDLPGSSAVSPRIAASSAGGSYHGVDTDFTVDYGDTWVDMSATDATIGEFSLMSATTPTAVVSFSGRATTETNRDAYFEDIVARESLHSGFVDSVISGDRLLIVSWTSDTELAVLEYVFVDDETVVTVMVTITGSNPERAIPNVRDIQLNGVDLLQGWDSVDLD